MKKFWQLSLAALLVLGIAFTAVGCGGQAEEQPAAEKKILKVGMEATYAPFEYTDDNSNIIGFDADLIRAIAAEMGYEAELSNIEWDGLDPALNSGQVDAVISAVTITPERQLEMDFSEPYFEASQIIAVRDDSAVAGMADLVPLKVGVQANTTGQYVCEQAGVPDAQIVKYATIPEAMMNLANGSLDAVVADSPVVMNYLATNPEVKAKTVSDNFDKEFYGIKVKKGNAELLAMINDGLKKVQENGKFDEVFSTYFKK